MRADQRSHHLRGRQPRGRDLVLELLASVLSDELPRPCVMMFDEPNEPDEYSLCEFWASARRWPLRRARALFISPPGKRQALDEMQNGGKRGRSGGAAPRAATHGLHARCR